MVKDRKRNGFAITTILFGMLILFMLLLVSSLAIMSSSLKNKQKLVNNELGASGKNIAKMLPNREYANYNALKSAVDKDNSKAVSWLYCFSDNNECRYISLNELLGIGEKVYFNKTINSFSSDKSLVINHSGYYYIEACGASGGNASIDKNVYVRGGKGTCADGYVKLSAGDNLFFNIGTEGTSNNGNGLAYGGYNGGGDAKGPNNYPVGSGGGATDIRLGYDYYDSSNDEIKQVFNNKQINYLGPDIALSKGVYQIDVYGENVNKCAYTSDNKYSLSKFDDQNPSHVVYIASLNNDLSSFVLHAYQNNYTDSKTVKCNIQRENISKLSDRIIVAAGGGGASYKNDSDYGLGGNGGDLVGISGGKIKSGTIGTGGNQQNGANSGNNIFSGGNTSNGAGGGGGYYGGKASGLYSGAGGGSSFVSGYAGVNSSNSLTKSYMINNSKYVYGADSFLLDINGRKYYKKNSEMALLGYFTSNNYTGPILVGTSPSSVSFYAQNVSGCENINASNGVLNYDGVTYYYSGTDCFVSGNRNVSGFTKLTSTNIISAAREILGSYHFSNTLHYSGKYFIDSSIISGKNNGNGYVNISYVGMDEPERSNILKNVRYVKECINGFYTIDEKSGNKVYKNSEKEWAEFQIIKNGVNLVKNNPNNLYATVPKANDNQVVTKIDDKVTDGIIDNYSGNNLVVYTSPNNKKVNEQHCLIYDLGTNVDVDEIALWHNYVKNGTYDYDRLSVSSDRVNWKEISFDGISETSNGKRVNAWEKISNIEEKHYSKVTYDYNVNKKIIQKEYYDTDYVVDWDYDFEIETTVNIPTLGQLYMIFSSFESKAPYLAVTIEKNNSIKVNISGAVDGNKDQSKANTVFADEDIKVLFKWDSIHDTWILTAKGEKTNIVLSNSRFLNEKILKSLRFGNADYRANPQNIYRYPITVKSFKISTMYLSNTEIASRPVEIIHFDGDEAINANGMIADETYLLEQLKATPDKDILFVANWGKEIKLVNMTFDYNVNTKTVQKEYFDTGYTLNWDADFEIETKIRVPSLGKNYLIFSSLDSKSTKPFVMMTINTNNIISVNINGTSVNSKTKITANEDILISFKWDSLHTKYNIKAKGKKTDIELIGTIKLESNAIVGRDNHTLRFGGVDYRTNIANTYLYPIIFKSFKITAVYGSSLKFVNKPFNVIHYEEELEVKPKGLYSSDGINITNVNNVPEEDTLYKVDWNTNFDLVNITYDYKVNKEIARGEYFDTGYKIDWNKDFEIKTKVNISSLNQYYLFFSDYDGKNRANIYMYIDTSNKNMLKLVVDGANILPTNKEAIIARVNEDIAIDVKWDSFNSTMTFSGKVGNDAEKTISKTIALNNYLTVKSANTLRFGSVDYRANIANTYLYPTRIKEFKITSQYVNNTEFKNRPLNVIHYEDEVEIKPKGLYASGGTNITSVNNVPSNNTTYIADWNTNFDLVNITYDYNVNKEIARGEYFDTGYKIDWYKDFEIKTTVNISSLNQNYLFFSDYDGKNKSNIYMYIDTSNKNMLKLVVNGANILPTNKDAIIARVNEDIDIDVKWDSFNSIMTFTGKVGNDEAKTTSKPITLNSGLTVKSVNTLRFGSVDYRANIANTYLYPTRIKEFKVTSQYVKNTEFRNRPLNVIHYEDEIEVKPKGLFTSDGTNITNVNNVPSNNTTYIADWNTNFDLVNITYDYKVNKEIARGEYFDTGYRIDWYKDFEIKTTVNISSLNQNYLFFSDFDGKNKSNIYLYIDTSNKNMLKLVVNGTNILPTNKEAIIARANEDIAIDVKWDSFNSIMTFSGKVGNDEAKTFSKQITLNSGLTVKSVNTLRFGSVDYRANIANTYLYQTRIKEFKITSQYVKNTEFRNRPLNVIHYEDEVELKPKGLFTSGGTNITNVNTVPSNDTAYMADWNTNFDLVNITYDYKVNKTYNVSEYVDTGYKINWNKDFEIKTIVNIPTLRQNYLIFSDSGNGKTPSIELMIDSYNRIIMRLNGNNSGSVTPNNSVYAEENIEVIVTWDSYNSNITLTAKGISTNISLSRIMLMNGKSYNTLRFGNADHRSNSQNTFKNPITVSEFKILEKFVKGYSLISQPVSTDGGYIIRNWKKSDDSILNNGEIISGDAIYNSNWVPNDFTLTVNSYGGVLPLTDGFTNNANNTIATKNVTFDSAYGILPVPTRNGYIFDGWYTAINGGILITDESIVTQPNNHILYARWKR